MPTEALEDLADTVADITEAVSDGSLDPLEIVEIVGDALKLLGHIKLKRPREKLLKAAYTRWPNFIRYPRRR